jgi:hypothetical protein
MALNILRRPYPNYVEAFHKMLTKSPGIDRLIDIVGSGQSVARALGMSPTQVSRVRLGQSGEREYFAALAELLELVPIKDWPERWNR